VARTPAAAFRKLSAVKGSAKDLETHLLPLLHVLVVIRGCIGDGWEMREAYKQTIDGRPWRREPEMELKWMARIC
jgi:hypothetical protein